ncbi:disulfide bond formation protein DsbB [Paenochrobactrum gallinarii]|uniref:Disulfide bond formation protein DsbB n=1 Tax=Paenochrobactrum gallinarii TaxID=643673 RepID=A0A841M4K5_9HYPH|nr:disulfide bond formation protein B [Paenochrobactrum gallinarii]MBB6261231.1 disulfide bond formation protein DsbB [Paenochrobactrum gallinarii]
MSLSLKALNHPVDKIQTATAAILFIGMAGTVGTALAFEHWGGFMPCKLCLEQRTPYYIGIPLMAAALLFAKAKWSPVLTRVLLLIGALLMSYGLMLAIYHTGVELKYWPGPADCSTASMSITTEAGSLLGNINKIRPPACDEAAGHFLGLSFPGWNILASVLFAAVGFYGAFSTRKA